MPDTFLSVSKATDDAREMGLNHTLLTVLASVLPGCMQHGRQAGRLHLCTLLIEGNMGHCLAHHCMVVSCHSETKHTFWEKKDLFLDISMFDSNVAQKQADFT